LKIIRHPSELEHHPKAMALAIGAFDGLHLGHRALLTAARDALSGNQGETWVLTFQPHPLKVLQPEQAPALLTSFEQKMELLKEAGVDGVIAMPFTTELSKWEPEGFLDNLVELLPQLSHIVVGPNWRFGREGRGDTALLELFALDQGLEALVVEPIHWEGDIVSSTRIRRALQKGEVEAVATMLGRPFSVFGPVVEGRQAGRELGFPTANVLPTNEVLPAPGIYAARTNVEDTLYDSAVYLDPRHPVEGRAIVESHLIDTERDLYGMDLEVRFIKHLRPPCRFNSPEEALRQIGMDIAMARDVLA
jgi:riboflavin kinase/FMN adenylyltransferase